MPIHIKNALWGDSTVELLIDDGVIAAIGDRLESPTQAQIFDADGLLLWPGMVNTHHHLAQSLLKGMPAGIDAGLDEWLPAVPFNAWPHIDAENLYVAAMLGLSDLLLSGCTTCADHHYLYQAHGSQELEDALVQAADDVGMRFVLCRGGATTSGSHRGLTQTAIVNETLST